MAGNRLDRCAVVWGGLQAPGTFRRQREGLAELNHADVQHEEGDEDADCRVENLLQILHLLILLPLRFLNNEHRRRFKI